VLFVWLAVLGIFSGLVGPLAFGCGFFIAGAVHALGQRYAGESCLAGRFPVDE